MIVILSNGRPVDVPKEAHDEIMLLRRLISQDADEAERTAEQLDALKLKLDAAAHQLAALRGFAESVLQDWPDANIDMFDVQDIAIEYGLLSGEQRSAPCSEEGCWCADYYGSDGMRDGVVCYKRSELLTGAAGEKT